MFNLDLEDEKIKSQTLLSLATVFSRYSSSSVFGKEDESPQVLRDYAYALMSKENELNPEITEGNFNDWKDRRFGLNNAFACTAVLSSIMIEYAKYNFNEVISQITPPVWVCPPLKYFMVVKMMDMRYFVNTYTTPYQQFRCPECYALLIQGIYDILQVLNAADQAIYYFSLPG